MVGMGQSSTNQGASVGGSKAKSVTGPAQKNDQTNGKTVGTPGVAKK